MTCWLWGHVFRFLPAPSAARYLKYSLKAKSGVACSGVEIREGEGSGGSVRAFLTLRRGKFRLARSLYIPESSYVGFLALEPR